MFLSLFVYCNGTTDTPGRPSLGLGGSGGSSGAIRAHNFLRHGPLLHGSYSASSAAYATVLWGVLRPPNIVTESRTKFLTEVGDPSTQRKPLSLVTFGEKFLPPWKKASSVVKCFSKVYKGFHVLWLPIIWNKNRAANLRLCNGIGQTAIGIKF